jgi:hypothetical protein
MRPLRLNDLLGIEVDMGIDIDIDDSPVQPMIEDRRSGLSLSLSGEMETGPSICTEGCLVQSLESG